MRGLGRSGVGVQARLRRCLPRDPCQDVLLLIEPAPQRRRFATRRRTRKPSPDPFEEVDQRKQSYGMDGDGGTDEVLEEQGRMINMEEMKVADLRELASARSMRGHSKLKKGELIDHLKGVIL
ncbi:hypothetical protein C2845_PM07G38170 [Panicum miliaceum]|uniref:Rho termination factor N-terminal domain-containing protein n=1 Tax=Panicum miliaceum TaxID=4540 RepID=A0A3L6SPF2_PANMI|nr:hypothetical protein C2845_PM07G38170 [Panicum miliaceum]